MLAYRLPATFPSDAIQKVGKLESRLEDAVLAELKDKSQLTTPKSIVKELGLKRGDMFDVVID